jgi:hypothetical protein
MELAVGPCPVVCLCITGIEPYVSLQRVSWIEQYVVLVWSFFRVNIWTKNS